jgi:hypothetical protein
VHAGRHEARIAATAKACYKLQGYKNRKDAGIGRDASNNRDEQQGQ